MFCDDDEGEGTALLRGGRTRAACCWEEEEEVDEVGAAPPALFCWGEWSGELGTFDCLGLREVGNRAPPLLGGVGEKPSTGILVCRLSPQGRESARVGGRWEEGGGSCCLRGLLESHSNYNISGGGAAATKQGRLPWDEATKRRTESLNGIE